MYDLHTHTRHSDGTTSPSENAALAEAEGLAGLALTDHDTFEGWAEAESACARRGLELVPGVELSAELDGASVHLLGYWVDPEHPPLRDECDRLRHERDRRARAMVERLAALGVPVSYERVAAIAGHAPIGRPHVAAALVEAGHVADVPAAFDAWIGEFGPAYVTKHALDPEAAVRLIVQAGGAAVLAHPGAGGSRAVDPPLVQRLAAAGLAGVEVHHPAHDLARVAFWSAVAREFDLCLTGSSDFHGDLKAVRIGSFTTPRHTVELLREHARFVPGDPGDGRGHAAGG